MLRAKELDQAFQEANAQLQKLDDKVALERAIDIEARVVRRAGRALGASAARDRDGLVAHAECAATARAVDRVLYTISFQGYFDATGNYAKLGPVLEGFAYRALARRAYDKHGALLAKYSGAKLNELRKRVAELDRQIIGRLAPAV